MIVRDEPVVSPLARHARRLFAGIAPSYERVAAVLSLGQDPRWRRTLVASLHAGPQDRVLDVATGTGMVARVVAARYDCRVVGLDQSPEMLARAVSAPIVAVRASGERLPFADASFDHVTFTYLLRYVDDTAATIRELVRVLRPGGRIAMLEFAVPEAWVWRVLWRLHTRLGLPLASRLLGRSWEVVGDFLGPSIEGFYAAQPQPDLEDEWRAAGLDDVAVRRMSLGGGIVMTATRAREKPTRACSAPQPAPAPDAAFYALRPGGWRDYWTLLHPPYTVWHLSYVLLGAAVAPVPDPRIVVGAVTAFGLAVGVGSHVLDELQGRPLGTRIPAPVLATLGLGALALAAGLGVLATAIVGHGFAIVVLVGVVLVLAYGLELPLVHSDIGFALAWGAFPVVATGYALGAAPLPLSLASLGAAPLSLAQRRLSTPVRALRRRAVAVVGLIQYRDGSAESLDAPALIRTSEAALQLLWLASLLLGAGVLVGRWS
jgi:demethylmenaquinone methyltransferase/2-methoxy-6-polyprenyl-1,4-benzoquinol methylase